LEIFNPIGRAVYFIRRPVGFVTIFFRI